MVALQVVLFIAVSIFTSSSLAQIDCYSGYTPKLAECQAALNSIVFEDDGTLQKVSKHVGTISGNCSIIVLNPNGDRVTKQEIGSELKKILEHCKPSAGGANLPNKNNVFLNIGARGDASNAPYESDFPANRVKCGLTPDRPDVSPDDCKKAYASIATDGKSRLVADSPKKSDSIKKTYKSCIVNIYTSDGSALEVAKDQLDPKLSELLNQCKTKDGVVHIQGGTAGKNGRTFLKVRSSNIP